MSSVDVSTWKCRNMWPLPDGSLAVRPGLLNLDSYSSARACFSVTEPNTLEVWHYVVTHSGGAATAKIRVFDENMQTLQVYDTGSYAIPEVVTFATVLDFLVIASPSFPTAFGFVGGGLIKALKQTTANGTAGIDVPQGLCVGWAGRVAYASGASLFFSDGITITGGDPRAISAQNQLDLGSTIRGLHVNAGGSLVAVTEGGVYALSEQAAAVGQAVLGDVQRLTDYRATRFGQTCSSMGRVWGLTRKGFRLIDVEGAEEVELDDPHMPVGTAERIQCEEYSDHCRMYETERGPMVAYWAQKGCYRYDVARQFGSWWTDTTTYGWEVVGILRERDGHEAIVSKSEAQRVAGNYDGSSPASEHTPRVNGFVMGRLPSPVEGSPVVRRVDVASDTGGNVLAACRGEAKTATTTQRGAVIGTDAWTDDNVTEPPLQSARFHYSTRTDDIAIEAGAENPLDRVDTRVSVEVRGPGKRGRP